ncbi:hypothetical protein RXV95_13335 [Novosphingobium sp. ZN18A2]|uniref:hypothetical protein n=1 Tax=Novosphingobium sp. ZN18A2 TaxID=3079861 RepID=UPI0030D4B204
MKFSPILAAAAVSLALAGCAKTSEPAPEGSDAPAASGMPVPAESAMSGVDVGASGGAMQSPVANEIPAAIQGRWGLTQADCTSSAGDAKGLLEIGPMNLKFYESMARLTKVAEDTDGHMKATFAFSGEGKDWSRELSLDAGGKGQSLVLTGMGGDAETGPLTYARCS